MGITNNSFVNGKLDDIKHKQISSPYIVTPTVQKVTQMHQTVFESDNYDFDDEDYWRDRAIREELDELNHQIENIYHSARYKIRAAYHDVFRPDLSIYFENIEYLKRILPGQQIIINDTKYLRVIDEDDIKFVDIKTGLISHYSYIAPKDYLLRDGMYIKYKEEENALAHYERTLNYFDRTKLLNAAMTVNTFDTVIAAAPVSQLDDATVLDFGCGTGETMLHVIKNYNIRKIVGVDYSKERIMKAIELMRSNNIPPEKYEFVISDVNEFVDYKMYSSYFDVILCFEIIEHLKNPEDVMEKLKDQLKLDGTIIGSVPLQEEPNETHLTAFRTIEDIETMLNVDVWENQFKMRFPNQHVFYYIK